MDAFVLLQQYLRSLVSAGLDPTTLHPLDDCVVKVVASILVTAIECAQQLASSPQQEEIKKTSRAGRTAASQSLYNAFPLRKSTKASQSSVQFSPMSSRVFTEEKEKEKDQESSIVISVASVPVLVSGWWLRTFTVFIICI